MKKLFCVLFALCLCIPTTISATEKPNNGIEEVIQLENGDYLEITLTEELAINTRATYAKTGTKSITYKNSDGAKMWVATITARFTYTGSSSTCTSATSSHKIYGTSWKVTTSASRSGNTATLKATGKQYLAGVLLNTINRSTTLKCSASGVLS